MPIVARDLNAEKNPNGSLDGDNHQYPSAGAPGITCVLRPYVLRPYTSLRCNVCPNVLRPTSLCLQEGLEIAFLLLTESSSFILAVLQFLRVCKLYRGCRGYSVHGVYSV